MRSLCLLLFSCFSLTLCAAGPTAAPHPYPLAPFTRASGPAPSADPAPFFKGKEGCFLVRDLQTGTVVSEYGSELCRTRLYACSTFKVALALMAFDSHLLQGSDDRFHWDGKRQPIKAWEKDQTTRSWIADSVVWVSQQLTPKLGLEKITRYLKDFQYGNQDFSGGLDRAWLSSTLKISAEEQTELLRRIKTVRLKVSPKAAAQTLALLPAEIDETALKLVGKTGSGFSWEDPAEKTAPPYRVGWYVGYLTKGTHEYVVATVFKEPTKRGARSFGGGEAKRITAELVRRATVAP